jgi:hypothetical protein
MPGLSMNEIVWMHSRQTILFVSVHKLPAHAKAGRLCFTYRRRAMRETSYFEAMANVAAAGLLGKLCDQAGAE